MLFDPVNKQSSAVARPALPKGSDTNYAIGFLFNFASAKSTRFDLEPLLLFPKKGGGFLYRRISLQASIGLAYLNPLPNALYTDYLEFSDKHLLSWMSRTGNRFLRNADSGSWAHVSGRELSNLRKHYFVLLQKVWPALSVWPHVFVLKSGRYIEGQQPAVKLAPDPVEVRIEVDAKADALIVRVVLSVAGKKTAFVRRGGVLLEHDNVLYLPPHENTLALLDQFKTNTLTFPLSIKKEVVNKYILPWLRHYPVTFSKQAKIELVQPDPDVHIRLCELNESNLMIRSQFVYEQEEVDYGSEVHTVVEDKSGLKIIERNKKKEQELHEYLRALHPSFERQRNNHYFYLPFDDVMKKGWFLKMLRNVQGHGYAVHGFPELKKFRYSTDVPEFVIKTSTKIDWFELKVDVKWGNQLVPLKEIRQAILAGQNTIMLEDGSLGHIPDEWISQYGLLLRTGTEENGVLRIRKMHFSLLENITEALDGKAKKEIEERKHKLLDYDSIPKVGLSPEIKASLRPYQLSGFHWLQALDDLGWGGCLADDMGLGKTLQTISFLQFLKDKYPGSTQLVVCPTSLIFNWENELQKFCPSLKYYIHYGVAREFNETHFEEYDVVLTSYGVVRNDQDVLAGFLWQYVILDESQTIKNPDARVTKAVRELKAGNRIILSGTPVQNNTSDLYAQFNFVNPGLLGSRDFFNREFATPIDKLGSKEKTEHLRKLIYPFTLRRTKEQVASDLPDKTISVMWCTMEAAQRKLYNEYRDGYKNKLLKAIDEKGLGKSGMDVLEGLLRLRQICDHPSLVDKEQYADIGSVKIDELVREVRENAGDHKVLVFSQFTGMLHLIRDQFIEHGVTFAYLDGSTPLDKRREEVTRFQEDPTITAFLISLKAGGVGLNLTVADYVYLVDPWWNPAAEQQAIDRAHRIGQKRKVFAYKMICKDSVEEKILQLQERKKMLADDLIHEDQGFVKNLTRDDVAFLFE